MTPSRSLAILTRAVVATLCVLLPLSGSQGAESGNAPVTAPDFVATSLTDESVQKLSALATDKVVLLNFWASWCYPCRVEMPEFQKLYERYRDRGFTVVAVSVYDELAPAKAYQEEQQFPFPMLFDHTEAAKDRFFVKVVPQTFLIGRDGKLIPIPNPRTGKAKLKVNDPTVWVQPETFAFIEEVLQR